MVIPHAFVCTIGSNRVHNIAPKSWATQKTTAMTTAHQTDTTQWVTRGWNEYPSLIGSLLLCLCFYWCMVYGYQKKSKICLLIWDEFGKVQPKSSSRPWQLYNFFLFLKRVRSTRETVNLWLVDWNFLWPITYSVWTFFELYDQSHPRCEPLGDQSNISLLTVRPFLRVTQWVK